MADYTSYSTDRVLGSSGTNYNAVFTTNGDNASLTSTDFMNLLVTQMQNQDFTNPMDDSTMVTEMAQLSNMEQMQQMAASMQANYAMGLVGKTATATRYSLNGEADTTTGVIDKVTLSGDEYVLYIGGKSYTLSELTSVQMTGSSSQTTTETGTASSVRAGDYDLILKQSNASSALINWPAPTEDSETAENLKYTLYYSTSKDMDTVENVTANGAIAGSAKQTGITQMEATGLLPDTTYYFNVLVEEPNGAKSVYKMLEAKTPAEE